VVHLFDLLVTSYGHLRQAAVVTGRCRPKLNAMDLPRTTPTPGASSSFENISVEFLVSSRPCCFFSLLDFLLYSFQCLHTVVGAAAMRLAVVHACTNPSDQQRNKSVPHYKHAQNGEASLKTNE
jgi:hypothetical protein